MFHVMRWDVTDMQDITLSLRRFPPKGDLPSCGVPWFYNINKDGKLQALICLISDESYISHSQHDSFRPKKTKQKPA